MNAPRDEEGDLLRAGEVEDQWDARDLDRLSTHPRNRTAVPKTSGGGRPVWADEWAPLKQEVQR